MHPPSFASTRRFLVAFMVAMLAFTAAARAFPAGKQTYMVLGYEEQLMNNLLHIMDDENPGDPARPNPMFRASSNVSLSVGHDGQIFIWDHWEDGFEADLTSPTNVYPGGTTEIWGDGNLTNGIPPGDDGDDILEAGQVISLESRGASNCLPNPPTLRTVAYGNDPCTTIPINPRNPTGVYWDGGDIFVTAGSPVNLVHVMFPGDTTSVTVLGGAWEIFPLETFDQSFLYTVPVGVDTYAGAGGAAGAFENFKYVDVQVQSLQDGTSVIVDNGTNTATFNLDKGQTWSSYDQSIEPGPSVQCIDRGDPDGIPVGTGCSALTPFVINANTTITSGGPVQVGYLTGGDGNFQTRFYNIIPTGLYSTEYMSPVFSAGGAAADLYINNPNPGPITITFFDSAGTGTFAIPGNTVVSYRIATGRYIPAASSVRLQSDGYFWGIGAYDTGALVGNGQGGDWGWVLQAAAFLNDNVFVAHGPGHRNQVSAQTGTGNGSPIWVAPIDDGAIFEVDWDGLPGADPSDIDNNGTPDGTQFTVNALQTLTLYDPSDNNQTGAIIRTTNNRVFTAAWGYNETGATNDAGPFLVGNLDWGYSINPFDLRFQEPLLIVDKTVDDKFVSGGDTVTFTICARTESLAPVSGVDLTDLLPSRFTYVPGTAVITYPSGATVNLDPTITGSAPATLTWDISQDLNAGETLCVSFDAIVSAPPPSCPVAGTIVASENWTGNSYSNSQPGTNVWVDASWDENDEGADSPNNDEIRAANDGNCPNSPCLRMDDAEGGLFIQRQLNISSANICKPELTFDWHSDTNNVGDTYNLQASTDGVTWTTIKSFERDSEQVFSEALDLGGFQSATAYLRVLGDDSNDNGDLFYLDNLVVRERGASPTITDDFEFGGGVDDARSYMLGTGWASNWIETSDGNSPTGGEIRVVTGGGGDECGNDAHLQLVDNDSTIVRAVVLDGMTTPQIQFNSSVNFSASNETFLFQRSNDGTNWITVRTWVAADEAANCQAEGPFALPTTTRFIRFLGGANIENSDELWIDDILISDSTPYVHPPPVPTISSETNTGLASGTFLGLPITGDDDEEVYFQELSIVKAATTVLGPGVTEVGGTITY